MEHEVMFLCVDTYSLYQGISQKKSLYSRVIKQNGKALFKVDQTLTVDENSLIHLGVFTKSGRREANSEELANSIKQVNKISLEARKQLKNESGVKSHKHKEIDDWFNNIQNQEIISNLSQYRKEFAHRLDSLDNLEKALELHSPNAINGILNVISINTSDRIEKQWTRKLSTL